MNNLLGFTFVSKLVQKYEKKMNHAVIKWIIFILGKPPRVAVINKQQLKIAPDEVPVPEGDKVNYTFSGLGHLIFMDHQFFRSFSRGQDFVTIYKCLNYKTSKCPVMLKTRGKSLVSIAGHHNHWFLNKNYLHNKEIIFDREFLSTCFRRFQARIRSTRSTHLQEKHLQSGVSGSGKHCEISMQSVPKVEMQSNVENDRQENCDNERSTQSQFQAQINETFAKFVSFTELIWNRKKCLKVTSLMQPFPFDFSWKNPCCHSQRCSNQDLRWKATAN